jgi:DNA (cytosine-5)-methyltransferase 1
MNVISLFSGCGGLDLGFKQAGFKIIWANEYDKTIWKTYELNHQETYLDRRDIKNISSYDIPDCIGIIGGPPCQSWSEAGAGRGIDDSRGKLFYEYIRIVKDKQPLFFLAENVSGILATKHDRAFINILSNLRNIGYEITYQLLNANDFSVPQDRKRVIIIGYHEKLHGCFEFPQRNFSRLNLENAIYDLKDIEPISVKDKIYKYHHIINNHEYLDSGFSSMYMSRNRVRIWNEPSFTIQAGGRHAPLHPQANKMIFVSKDKYQFDPQSIFPYRRLSVRECARIQTFPDNFIFKYDRITNAYKMIGNAVPVNLSFILAKKIFIDIQEYLNKGFCTNLRQIKYPQQLSLLNL